MMRKSHLVFFMVIFGFSYAMPLSAEDSRWYSDEQVTAGKQVFRDNCSVCHGVNAEATADWKKTGPDGHYPPPPLNGSAHAWHHPIGQLRRTVREGGQRLGGVMPPFKEKLSDSQIDEAIAFFQSMWSDEIYAEWERRHQGEEKRNLIKLKEASLNEMTRYLTKMAPSAELSQPRKTPIENLQQIRVDGEFMYLIDDGRYLLTGDLIDLKAGNNLTQVARNSLNRGKIETFSESDMLVYPATVQERSVITVFTDTSCPYCKKLHADIPELTSAGISIRYIPFPRGGESSQGYRELASVWCAENPKHAMDTLMQKGSTSQGASSCDRSRIVNDGYLLGRDIGIRGTPALILEGGEKIDGYLTPKRLQQELDKRAS